MTKLDDLKGRVEAYLNDTSFINFSETRIEEGMTQALDHINLHLGARYTVIDLAGAVATDFPVTLETCLVLGTVGYTLQGQAVALILAPNVPQGMPAAMAAAAARQVKIFEDLVQMARTQGLQSAEDAPYAAWAWDESGTG